LLRSLAFVK